MLTAAIILTGLLLAGANGANDNFKGVATLFGSRTTGYRSALMLATVATALGSVAALALADGMIGTFSGNGLVPAGVAADPAFSAAVGLGAALTVLLATWVGFPVSTTHALTGALAGAGAVAARMRLDGAHLADSFFLPLLAGPVIALALTAIASQAGRRLTSRFGTARGVCVCTGEAVLPGGDSVRAMALHPVPAVAVDSTPSCRDGGRTVLLSLDAGRMMDFAHYLSAGAVSFARGLNDTPKIAALLLTAPAIGLAPALLTVGVLIAGGGILGARRVAETLSHRITDMEAAGGLTANIVTSVLVIGASRWGMPVSTTHVSCGALFGIGAVSGGAHWGVIRQVLGAWLITLPLAGILAAVSMAALSGGL